MAQDSILLDISLPALLHPHISSSRYRQFLRKACAGDTIRHAVISFPFTCKDPLKWFEAKRSSFQFQYYWEKPDASSAIAALGNELNLSAHGPHRFRNIEKSLAEARNHILRLKASTKEEASIRFVGGFSFFDDMKESEWQGYPPASITLPGYVVTKNTHSCTISVAFSLNAGMSIDELHQKISKGLDRIAWSQKNGRFSKPSISEKIPALSKSDHPEKEFENWKELVEQAKNAISEKTLEKVVLGRLLRRKLPADYHPVAALRYLRRRYPGCYTFLLKHENTAPFIGSTPELLLSVTGLRIQTEALAGSIARSNSKDKDKKLERRLLKSFKNNSEHRFVVDDIKKWIAPFVRQLNSANQPEIKKLSNVQHLYTPIKGTLNENSSPLALLGRLHPTPAVGGTPRENALAYIRRYEPFSRGWFAGPIGWVSTEGEAEFAVAIRSGLITGNTASLFAGCGIVADSDPELEWQETHLKFKPMLSALNYD